MLEPRSGEDVEVSVRTCDKCSLVARQLWRNADCLTKGAWLLSCASLQDPSFKMFIVKIITVHPFRRWKMLGSQRWRDLTKVSQLNGRAGWLQLLMVLSGWKYLAMMAYCMYFFFVWNSLGLHHICDISMQKCFLPYRTLAVQRKVFCTISILSCLQGLSHGDG